MRLDRTKIAIRERSLLDILDMGLRVFFVYSGPLIVCALLFVIPLMLINWYLIGWMPEYGDVAEGMPRYMWTMILLVAIEAPLLSVTVCAYLGQAMFADEVDWKELRATIFKSVFPLCLSHFVIRGIAVSWVLTTLIPQSANFSGIEAWLIVVVVVSVLIRASRPFINEIILLEQNPLTSKSKDEMTTGRRSTLLHKPNYGDLISRWMANTLVASLLVLSVLASLWFLWGMLLFNWNWGPFMIHFVFPLSLWMVAAYFAIVRFLCYLDLRIRREGWEVELMMRAAATHMTGPIV